MSRAQQREELVNVKRSIQQIRPTEGFKYYQKLLSDQIQNRRETMEQPSAGMEQMFAREFMSGEVMGLRLARDLLDKIETSVDEVLELLKSETEETQETIDE